MGALAEAGLGQAQVLTAGLLLGTGAWWWWRYRVGLPDWSAGDAEEYLRGSRAPRPFCWRWLLAGRSPRVWRWAGILGLILTVPAILQFSGSWTVVGMWILLAPLWERSIRIVHLADAPAMACALWAASLPGPWSIPLALLAGGFRETAPVFAALWSGNPWCLAGLLAVPWWRRGGPPFRHHHLFVHPWRTFSRMRWKVGFSWQYAVPFGGMVLGVWDPWVWLTVLVAAIPLFRSVDSSRLLLWAAPQAAVAAAQLAPPGILLAASLLASSEWRP